MAVKSVCVSFPRGLKPVDVRYCSTLHALLFAVWVCMLLPQASS